MSLLVSLRLALSYLGVGKSRSQSNARKSLYGALLGIALSLVPLIVIIVVADGMIFGITSRMIELSRSHISAVPDPRSEYTAGELLDLAERIAELPGMAGAWPERQGVGIAVGPNGRSGGQIRAVPPAFFDSAVRETGLLQFSSIIMEDIGEEFAGRSAFMGEKLARDLGLAPGDTFRLLTMREASSGRTVPRFTSFTLRDTVSSGYQEMDALWIFVPFESGFDMLDGTGGSTFISARTRDAFSNLGENLDSVSRALPSGFFLYTWQTLNRSQLHSFNTTRLLLVFVAFMILLVAAVNISSAMVMLVLERRREIAVLKAAGATPACIAASFLIAGFLTGLGGLLIGLPAGVLCALHINSLFGLVEKCINAGAAFFRAFERREVAELLPQEIRLLDPALYLESIPVALDFSALFLVAAGTLGLSVLFSLVPAWRSGRERPVEILRKG